MASHTSNTRISWLLAGALSLAFAMTALSAPSHVAAQDDSLRDSSYHDRPQMLSFFTGFHFGGWPYSFGGYGVPWLIGARYYIPIVPNGFIPSLNDEFGIEFGLDMIFTFPTGYRSDFETVMVGFGIPADAMWDFHFSPRFDAYAKVGFSVGGRFSDYYDDGFWYAIHTAVGLRFKINDVLNLRAEVGYPAIMFGLGIAL
jgi:opacity protein-like surface antigen